MQELEDEKQAEENKKKKKQKRKGKHKVDVDDASAASAATAGHAAGAAARKETEATALKDGTVDCGWVGVGGGLLGGTIEEEDPGGGTNGPKTQSGRAKRSGRGRGGCSQGAVAASVAGDSGELGEAVHAAAVLGVEMAELSLAPGAGNVAAQGIRQAESLFLAKFQVVGSDAPSPAEATAARSRDDCARATGDGGDCWPGGGGATGAKKVLEVWGGVKGYK